MKKMNPEDIVVRMEESHKCAGCDNLVIEIEFQSGALAESGCHCEIGGEG